MAPGIGVVDPRELADVLDESLPFDETIPDRLADSLAVILEATLVADRGAPFSVQSFARGKGERACERCGAIRTSPTYEHSKEMCILGDALQAWRNLGVDVDAYRLKLEAALNGDV